MASPWKILARLVSPRRQPKEETGPSEDARSTVPAIAQLEYKVADQHSEGAEIAQHELKSEDQSAGSVDPQPSEAVVSDAGDTDAPIAEPVAETRDPVLVDDVPVTAPAPVVSRTGKGRAAKQDRDGKKTGAVLVAPEVAPQSLAPSNAVIDLDDEIRVLRDQLVHKLQLQNAQLKKMLERFEH